MSSIKANSQKFIDRSKSLNNSIVSNSQVPQVSALMANAVSHVRKEGLEVEVEHGIFRDGSTPNGSQNKYNYTDASNVASSIGFKKQGQILSGGGGFKGTNDSVKQTPEVYSPLWLSSNLNLPRDRATINAWCRAFFALNPFVHNAISLHSTYPISKLNIKCPNKEIEKFFNDMIEELDLMNICVQIAQEFWLLGEAFVYAELDESRGKWSRFLIQNPDYMIVKRTVVANEPLIMLKPDENLKTIVRSNKPTDIEQRKQLNQHIIDCVRRGENIPLDNFHVSHLARRISPYEIRGTGLPVCIFRQLMLFDKLRESKYAQADNMINPLTLVKVGGGAGDYKPTHADLEAWRSIFEEAQYDKDFKIFTHEAVTVERVGYGQGIFDISGDITQLMKEIYIGLQVPQVLMDGGADTTYANGGVALDVLRQRYMQFRNMMSLWLKRKIFAPISKIQGFYEYKKGSGKSEKQLIVPDVDWNHMALFDTDTFVQNLTNLTQGEGDQKRVSLHTLYRSIGLDWEDEQRKMKKESIAGAIMRKEKQALDAMDLNSLRAITEDEEITEPDNMQQQPGGEAPVPGEAPPGGDIGGGGLPPLPGLPPPPPGGDAPPPAPEATPPPPEAPAGGGPPPAP